MKRLTAVLAALLMTFSSISVQAQEYEPIVRDGKLQKAKVEVFDEFEFQYLSMENLPQRILTELVNTGTSRDSTIERYVETSIFPVVKSKELVEVQVFRVVRGEVRKMPQLSYTFTNPAEARTFPTMIVYLILFLTVCTAIATISMGNNYYQDNHKKHRKDLFKFFIESTVMFAILASAGWLYDTLPPWTLGAGIVVGGIAILFLFFWLRTVGKYENFSGSFGFTVFIFGIFIIAVPAGVSLQMLLVYAGFCITAYLIGEGVYLILRDRRKEDVAAVDS